MSVTEEFQMNNFCDNLVFGSDPFKSAACGCPRHRWAVAWQNHSAQAPHVEAIWSTISLSAKPQLISHAHRFMRVATPNRMAAGALYSIRPLWWWRWTASPWQR